MSHAEENSTTRDNRAAPTRLRVLFLATFFPKPDNRIMGTWALAQAKALARRGIDMRVVSLTSWVPRVLARSRGARAYADCPGTYDWDGLRVDYPRFLLYAVGPLRRRQYIDPRAQLAVGWHSARGALRRVVREHKPDVIFCHHSVPNGYLASRLLPEFGLPFVVTDHDFSEIVDCEKFPGRRSVYERVTSTASANVCVARRMEADMKRLFPGAPAVTVHNGIDPLPASVFDRPRPAEIAGKTVLFSCGMFYERKAFPLLIEAFDRVAHRHPDAVLRIAGDGDERPRVDEALRKARHADRVQMLGKIAHADVMQEMAWSDAFALVGWDEPFATVFIEAMGAGSAVITASDGGINDVVVDGEHGLSVPPRDVAAAADAIDRMLGDADLRQRMGRNARELVERSLTWDANARRMAELFEAARGG